MIMMTPILVDDLIEILRVTSICQHLLRFFKTFFYFAGCVTAAAGLVGAASVPQLVKFKGCVCSRYGKVPPSPPPPPELRKCCVLGPPTHRPVRGAARLVGEPFLLCVIGRSTSDVLGGPRNADRRSDGQLWDDSTCHGVDSLSTRTSCLACVSWPVRSFATGQD